MTICVLLINVYATPEPILERHKGQPKHIIRFVFSDKFHHNDPTHIWPVLKTYRVREPLTANRLCRESVVKP